MAKKKTAARKPSGAAGIEVIDEVHDVENGHLADDGPAETVADHAPVAKAGGKAAKPPRAPKAKAEPPTNGHVGVGDIRKAAAFANSMGGLDKAISLLQILKVAKEVQ